MTGAVKLLHSCNVDGSTGQAAHSLDLQEHPPRRYCDVLQEKYALHQLEPMMVPCPSSKTLGPATNSFEHQLLALSLRNALISCQVGKTAPVTPGMQAICQRQVEQFRGASRPIAADIGSRAPFAGAEAVPVCMGPLINSPCCNILSFLLYYYYYIKTFICRLNLPDFF